MLSSRQVFVSHSSKDKEAADAVRAALEARGLRCWIAPRDIEPGSDWSEAIVAGLTVCAVTVLVFSENANASAQVRREVQFSFENRKTVVPFRIEDARPTGAFAYYLNPVHWLSAFPPPLEPHLPPLVEFVRGVLGDPQSAGSLSLHAVPTDTPPALSPPPERPAFPGNLPLHLTSFIGRKREIAEVQRLLSGNRLVTLAGYGGCGKTRLALQAAAEALNGRAFPGGVWLVELAALSSPALVVQEVATGLGVREQAEQSLLQTLTEYLREKQLLLVLDNCEHLLTGCASVAAALLRACPDVRLLATSREPLGIAGEQVYRVPCLSLPDPKQALAATPENLAAFESVRLFIERAQAVKPEFVCTSGNASALARLCHRLDGIPLALELAAARIRALSVDEIETRLDQCFRLLTGGNRAAMPRQQTLRAAVDWSYDLLTEAERLLLARLSVFAGGWTLTAAEAVCGFEPLEDFEVLDLLTSLADKSLVVVESPAVEEHGEPGQCSGTTRYRMLETIRLYANQKVAEWPHGSGECKADEAVRLRTRHRGFFLALAEEAEPHLMATDQREWLERLEAEHDNLRAALEECARNPAQDTEEAGLRLAGALWRFWLVRGYVSEGRDHLARVLEAARQTSAQTGSLTCTVASVRVLLFAGNLANHQGDYTAARKLFEEGLTICRDMADPQGTAWSLLNLGNIARAQGDYPGARALFQEGLSISQTAEDSLNTAWSLLNLGNLAYQEGDYTGARTYFEEGLALFRQLGDRLNIAWSLLNLGNVARSQGDNAEARTRHEEGLAICRELGDRRGIAQSLKGLAHVAWSTSQVRKSVVLWGAAYSLLEGIGTRSQPGEQAEMQECQDQALSVLGDAEFAAAWEVGRGLSADTAVAYALEID